MRKFDWIVFVLLIVLAAGGKFSGFGDDVPDQHNPRRPPAEMFEPQYWDRETRDWLSQGPSRSQNEIPARAPLPIEGIIEQGGKKAPSTGSAFSVSRDGYWLTARHVAEGCRTTIIQSGHREGAKVRRTVIHPKADVALLITKSAPRGLPVADRLGGARDAYSVGFPKGQPGAVHARFLGEMTMRHQGRGGFRERVYAWAERSRIPARFTSLGGLSGGAVIDERGRVIGVVQAESRRRGRIMTAKPETYLDVFRMAGVRVPSAGRTGGETRLTAGDYPQTARRLITTLRVAKVHCLMG